MSLSLRDRLRTMLELSEHATDDEICQVVGAKQTECDALACFRQAVVDALPLADAQDTDEQLIGQLSEHVDTRAIMRREERAKLAKKIYLRSIAPLARPDGSSVYAVCREEEAVAHADALLAALDRKPDPAQAATAALHPEGEVPSTDLSLRGRLRDLLRVKADSDDAIVDAVVAIIENMVRAKVWSTGPRREVHP